MKIGKTGAKPTATQDFRAHCLLSLKMTLSASFEVGGKGCNKKAILKQFLSWTTSHGPFKNPTMLPLSLWPLPGTSCKVI